MNDSRDLSQAVGGVVGGEVAAFTPGPWRVQSDHSVRSYAPGHWAVADCGGRRREANARLIAAAPDLLEALREAMDSRAADMADAAHPGWYDRARAAIAKASPSPGGDKEDQGVSVARIGGETGE